MAKKIVNAFYAQSGGVTAVINASAAGLIESAREHGVRIVAGHNGITGALNEELIDTSQESPSVIKMLAQTPGGIFGSCRYKLKNLTDTREEYERLFKIFAAHEIRYFFYNGGGDSQDTTHKIAEISKTLGYPLVCVGIPKTIDNDLPFTDCCPGFGSAAKYLATSVREIDYDLNSMSATSTKVFVLEVMGRHTGWLAAATGIAREFASDAPHIILFPEIPFDEEAFLNKVTESVRKHKRCFIVASEGIRTRDGTFLSDIGCLDAFGHTQLGGVAPMLAKLIKNRLHFKYHWAVADYLQRSARHLASKVDLEQAYAVGKAALLFALEGQHDVMASINRISDLPYRWEIVSVPLAEVANVEKHLPREYISPDGFHITPSCRAYLAPLISGEVPPTFKNGLPEFARLKKIFIPKRVLAD